MSHGGGSEKCINSVTYLLNVRQCDRNFLSFVLVSPVFGSFEFRSTKFDLIEHRGFVFGF